MEIFHNNDGTLTPNLQRMIIHVSIEEPRALEPAYEHIREYEDYFDEQQMKVNIQQIINIYRHNLQNFMHYINNNEIHNLSHVTFRFVLLLSDITYLFGITSLINHADSIAFSMFAHLRRGNMSSSHENSHYQCEYTVHFDLS